MNYIRYLLNGAGTYMKNIHVTLLTSSEAAEHPNCQSLISEFSGLIRLRIASPRNDENRIYRALGPFYERQWRHAELFARGFAEIGHNTVDFVILPHLEAIGLLQLALRPGLFHGKPWAAIAHAIRFHHRRSGVEEPFRALDILQHLFAWKVFRDPDLVCLASSDPYLARATGNPKIVFAPDPCTPPRLTNMAAARAAYGIQPETCLILVFGFIDRRKCVDVLLEGVARVVPELDLTVLLAGAQNPAHLKAALSGEAARKLRDLGRLVEVNRFINYDLDIDPMSAADIVWLFYERDFVRNSAVLTQSGLAGLPVIARRQGLVGRQVEEHQLGLALSTDAPDVIAAALSQLARDPALRRKMGENGARTFAANTPENFARPIVDAISRALSAR
jgi:glycosyltransferase involved in cell wall biosynthesis